MYQFYKFLKSKNIYITENINSIIEHNNLIDLIDNPDVLIYHLTTFGFNVIYKDKIHLGQSNVYENVGQQPDAIIRLYYCDDKDQRVFLN